MLLALYLETAGVPWAPCCCSGFLLILGEIKRGLRQRWQTTPSPFQTAFNASSENGCPPPDALFFSASPNSILPHRRDMLVWGHGGVPAFTVPSLCQSKVTPSTMSQPSQVAAGPTRQKLRSFSLPIWDPLNCHSPHSCQDTCTPHHCEVVRDRKADLSCGCQTLLERLQFSLLQQGLTTPQKG